MGRFPVGMATSMEIWAVAALRAISWVPITPCSSLEATLRAQRPADRTSRGLASTRMAQFQAPEVPVAPTTITCVSLTSTTIHLAVPQGGVACNPLPMALWGVDLALAPWAVTRWMTAMILFDCPLEGAAIEPNHAGLNLAGLCRPINFLTDPRPAACTIDICSADYRAFIAARTRGFPSSWRQA